MNLFATILFLLYINVSSDRNFSNDKFLKRISDNDNSKADNDETTFPIYTKHQRASPTMGFKRKSNCVKNFCEQVDDYPDKEVNAALSGTRKYEQFFEAKHSLLPAFSITDRGQFDYDISSLEETLCEVEVKHIFPKSGVNTNNTERIIVNNEQYQQLVVTETCRENAKCKYGDVFPNGLETSCKQKFMRKRLISLSDEKNAIFDTFDIPCCCVCTIRRKGLD